MRHTIRIIPVCAHARTPFAGIESAIKCLALPEATNCTRKFLRLGKSNAADAVYGGMPEVMAAMGYALWFTLERRQNWLLTPLILAERSRMA
ncbi:MAG: hypothetical protein EPN30_03595 [Actinomycetota bacterium]|nr:MAG: hypothetical protein EPN30_03595 [Actinomycetota bacterium]